MKVQRIELRNKSNFMIDYLSSNERVMEYYEYHPHDDFEKRLQELQGHSFKREELAKILHIANKKWGAKQETFQNIERLKDERSVVVVGGQQAGLLTGPLYTLNKIISILKLAKEQEETLKVPVIPVFWIAGEDHDFAEINHVHLLQERKIKKHQIEQYVSERTPVSDISLDKQKAKKWLDAIFIELQETVHTKPLYRLVKDSLSKSETYVDFFAQIIHEIFAGEGLVLFNSQDPAVRELERDYFTKLITHQPAISKSIYQTAHKVRQTGYDLTIEPEETDAHLFYHLNGERILLSRNEDNNFSGLEGEIELTEAELLQIAKSSPELLSNNVVTRPIMQDLLFPTLAFIGGWGEINYWSVLKGAYQELQRKMPPVVPRLSFTFLQPKIEKLLYKYSLQVEKVINEGVSKERINWLSSQPAYPNAILVEQIKEDMASIHEPLRKMAEKISPNLKELSETNIDYIQNKIDFLVRSIERELEHKQKHILKDFYIIEHCLFPDQQLQERIMNPIYLLNDFGQTFINKLIKEEISFQNEHYVVIL